MDKLIETAAKLPTTRIEESIPPSLLLKLKDLGRCLSVSWVGLFSGLFVPIQYILDYSVVELEDSMWTDPLIVWPLIHAPSGTRKSRIHGFINSLMNFGDYLDKDNILPQFKVQETTFENLGMVMEKNDGRVIWMFDEARHFFAQLGYYNKGGSSRDENLLLSLYDGGEWDHGTSSTKSAKFTIPKTRLALGGCTQTAHVVSLFENKEQMKSGLIPRFLVVMMEPVRTPINQLGKGDHRGFKEELQEKFKSIHQFHKGKDIKYVIKLNSKAFNLFSQYYQTVNSWCEKHEFKMSYQHAITLVSKSLGQILRVSAILNALFIEWNRDEVVSFENQSSFDGDVQEFESKEGVIPISVMALQSSLALVTYSITQNLLIQNIETFSFDLSSKVPIIRDIYDVEDSFAAREQQQAPAESSTISNKSPTASSSASSSTSVPPQEPSSADIAKVLLCGGKVLDARYLNNYKKLGSKTNKKIIFQSFNTLQSFAFGNWSNSNTFVLHDNLYERLLENEDMRRNLTGIGVSLSMLRESIGKENLVLQPPKKKLKVMKDDDISAGIVDITNKS